MSQALRDAVGFVRGLRFVDLLELVRFGPEYLRESWRHRRDRFDERYATETNDIVLASELGGVGQHGAGAQLYWPTNSTDFGTIMKSLNITYGDFSFVDLGCGKGRTLLMAALFKFGQVHGVEFSPALCDIARSNAGKFAQAEPGATAISVLCQDAAEFVFPLQPLVLYLFDPFGHEVLQLVLNNLITSLNEMPRPCYIVYYLPMHGELIARNGFAVVAEQRRQLNLKYPWTIYSKAV